MAVGVERRSTICYTIIMTPEKRRPPGWARRERQRDLEWIGENFHVFWPAATAAYVKQGRGAIVVDTTSRPTGEGNPFGYFAQAMLERRKDEDVKRMVREYDPDWEFVVVLLKPKDRVSSYRVQIKPRQPSR